MTDSSKVYPLHETARAQQALRIAAHLQVETQTLHDFVASIADEMDALHALGYTNESIAGLIRGGSNIDISAEDLSKNYEIPHHMVSPHD